MIKLPVDFFETYWQKKPCLLKAATTWRPEIAPDELAGIACEEESLTRIIQERTDLQGAERWQLDEGPFEDEFFSQLPDSHWTLLVQEVDIWDEQVNELLTLVPVIPQWRGQDVLASYAVDQGSVGPHYDHYDVFLVQGLGKRLWKIGDTCHEGTKLLPHDDLLLLKNMNTHTEHLLEPGDVLYIPPGVSHWGIAQGECMTFSIGFRAPSAQQALQELAERACPQLTEQLRYQDSAELIAHHQAIDHPQELASPAIEQFRHLLNASITDSMIVQWLGCRSTAPENRLPLLEEISDQHFESLWAIGIFEKHPQTRMAWHFQALAFIFCNGLDLEIELHLNETQAQNYLNQLCRGLELDINKAPFNTTNATKTIVKWLLEQEAIVPKEEL